MSEQEETMDVALSWSLRAVAIIAALMAVIAGFIAGVGVGAGVFAAGMLATANLFIFIHIVKGVLAGGRHGRLWALAAFTKVGALFGVGIALMKTGVCSGAELAIGYGALPLGIVIGSLVAPRPEEDHSGGGRDEN